MKPAAIRYVRFVPFALVEDHLRMGWMVLMPSALASHNVYGVAMAYLCECRRTWERAS